MELILLAMGRKVMCVALLLITYFLVDRFMLNKFNTAEAIQYDPKAISLLLGLLAVAIAIS